MADIQLEAIPVTRTDIQGTDYLHTSRAGIDAKVQKSTTTIVDSSETSVSNEEIALFDGTTGKLIKGNNKSYNQTLADTMPVPRQYCIDCDFNHNSTGVTSQSTNGYAVWDMWKLSDGTGSAVLSRIASSSTSKTYAARISGTSTQYAGITQSQKGKLLSDKKISILIKANYTTNKPSTFIFEIKDNETGTSRGFTSFNTSAIGTSPGWHRADLNVGTSAGTYTGLLFYNSTNQTWDLDIEKIRIYDKLPGDETVIPSWIDYDEDPSQSANDTFSYFPYFNPYFLTPVFGWAVGVSATEVRCFIPTPTKIIQSNGSLAKNTLGSFVAVGNGSSISLLGGSIANIDGYTNGVALQITGLSGISSNYTYVLRGTGGILAFDFRY